MQLYDYHEVFAPGAGINMETMERTFLSPFENVNEVPRGLPGATVLFDSQFSDSSTDLETGITLDAKAEVRYLTASGNLSAKWDTQVRQSQNDLSFCVKYYVEFGDYQLADPSLSAGASKIIEYEDWIRYYGTHVVVGTVRHAYVTASFGVHHLQSDIALRYGLSVNGSGSIELASASGSFDYQSLLKEVVKTTSIVVTIRSTVAGADFAAIIDNSTSLVNIFSTIGTISKSVPTSVPVPVSFWVARAEEVQPAFLNPLPTSSGMNNPIVVQQFQDYVRAARRVTRLDRITNGDSETYSFISDAWMNDLKGAQELLTKFMNDTLEKLIAWKKGGTPAHIVEVPSVSIWWPFPRLILGPTANMGDYALVDYDVQDVDTFRSRVVKLDGTQVADGGPTANPSLHRFHAQNQVPDSANLFAGDWKNWSLQILSPKGPDIVLAQAPIRQIH